VGRALYENFFNKKVSFAVHPTESVMVTVGEDKMLRLYDFVLNRLFHIIYLKDTPTAIKFSQDGDLLVVGFVTGDLRLLDSKLK
jgi:hypothetical protein